MLAWGVQPGSIMLNVFNGFIFCLVSLLIVTGFVAFLLAMRDGWNLWVEYFSRSRVGPLPTATVVRCDMPSTVPSPPVPPHPLLPCITAFLPNKAKRD